MVFTWSTNNLCIIFRSWRITGTFSLLWSLVAVAALTAGYEAVREASRRYEAQSVARIESLPRESPPNVETVGPRLMRLDPKHPRPNVAHSWG